MSYPTFDDGEESFPTYSDHDDVAQNPPTDGWKLFCSVLNGAYPDRPYQFEFVLHHWCAYEREVKPSTRTFYLHAHVAFDLLAGGKVDFAQGGFWEKGAQGSGITAGVLKGSKYEKLRKLTAKLVGRHYKELREATGDLLKAKPAKKAVPAAAVAVGDRPALKGGQMEEWPG
ncbi:MAG TPA: hypothetical protein VFC19_29275 [Candidatus Limnocylindrales bacterium]|nr:hypothetical protein [Candidatus Limnocylindrales bacterium]